MSSQSSTARSASGPTIRLPSRRSPCTVTGLARRAAGLASSAAQRQLEHLAGLPELGERGAQVAERVGAGRSAGTGSACSPAANAPSWPASTRRAAR